MCCRRSKYVEGVGDGAREPCRLPHDVAPGAAAADPPPLHQRCTASILHMIDQQTNFLRPAGPPRRQAGQGRQEGRDEVRGQAEEQRQGEPRAHTSVQRPPGTCQKHLRFAQPSTKAARTPARAPAPTDAMASWLLPRSDRHAGAAAPRPAAAQRQARRCRSSPPCRRASHGRPRSSPHHSSWLQVFDSTKGNATFAFRLGVGEVIKGACVRLV